MRVSMFVVYRYTETGHALIARFIGQAYAERYAQDQRARDPGATYDVEAE